MIVSGGKILGIHKVEHDITFSGDGVKTPLGLDSDLHQRILDTSAKLDKSAFESWLAQTENWDIDEYTGGDGIKVHNHEISVSGKYLTSEDLNPYATSSWVEENFLKQAVRVSYDPQTEELHLDFSPAPTDYVLIGDRLYHYVQIGDQLWIDENLDYKFAYDGGTLPIGASGTPSTPAAWYYGNDEATYGVDGNKYGLLYNWYAAKYLEDNKSTLLPEGWHVPSTTDWDTLATAVGGASTAGTVLKSATEWTTGAGTNDYGFNGVPAGCYRDGSPVGLDLYAYFWTSIEYNTKLVYYRSLATSNNSLSSNMNFKTDGYSIRLVKDVT